MNQQMLVMLVASFSLGFLGSVLGTCGGFVAALLLTPGEIMKRKKAHGAAGRPGSSIIVLTATLTIGVLCGIGTGVAAAMSASERGDSDWFEAAASTSGCGALVSLIVTAVLDLGLTVWFGV